MKLTRELGTSGLTRPRSLGDLGIAIISLLVVLLCVAYMLSTPQREELRLSATQVSTINKKYDVYYGKVVGVDGHPLSGYRVRLFHLAKSRKVTDKVGYTTRAGLYRYQLPARRGYEYVQFSNPKNTVRSQKRLAVRPGHAYRVNGRYFVRSKFGFAPVFSY